MTECAKAKKVWITRTDTGAAQSAKAIAGVGYVPLVAPLLKLSAVSTPGATPADDSALAFTSPNGVRAFAALSDRRSWPVFAVGDATAKAARRAGFETVHSAAGDVNDLAALIIKSAPAHITHLSGVHVAGDLCGALSAAGIAAERTIIYGSEAVSVLPERVKAALTDAEPLAVMLYSPKAAHVFCRLCPEPFAALVHCISISPNTDAVLNAAGGKFASRQIAPAPNEASMTALLEAVALKA